MSALPFWLDEVTPEVESRALERVDVAVAGAGITGCACARVLAHAGRRVRSHEARTVASGASGRNGGFALAGGATRYDIARETYGGDAARAYLRWTAP